MIDEQGEMVKGWLTETDAPCAKRLVQRQRRQPHAVTGKARHVNQNDTQASNVASSVRAARRLDAEVRPHTITCLMVATRRILVSILLQLPRQTKR